LLLRSCKVIVRAIAHYEPQELSYDAGQQQASCMKWAKTLAAVVAQII
jgi:hypothetical protein